MGLWLFACQPKTGADATREPTPSAAEGSSEGTPSNTLPVESDVVAQVDGVPIHAADLDVALRLSGKPLTDPAARSMVLLGSVEGRLLLAESERMEIDPRDEEIDGALDHIAASGGVSRAQMQEEVEKLGVTFEAYRREVAVQLAATKVLLRRADPGASTQEIDALRARLVGCLRAKAKITVNDATLSLPANPFAAPTQIAAFTFTFAGKPAIPEAELRKAAEGAAHDATAAGAPMCDALERTEVVLTQLYLDRGLLDARVQIPWPAATPPPVTIEIEVEAGLPHVIGTIAFDLPTGTRLDTKALQERVVALARAGDPATTSRVEAVTNEVNRTFLDAGFIGAQPETTHSPNKNRIRIDIVYHPR